MTVQTEIVEWLDERESRFVGIANQIWEHPEVALTETKACKLQADDLAADGFTITMGMADIPTAFMAEWAQGEGARDRVPRRVRRPAGTLAGTISRTGSRSSTTVPDTAAVITCWGPPPSPRRVC